MAGQKLVSVEQIVRSNDTPVSKQALVVEVLQRRPDLTRPQAEAEVDKYRKSLATAPKKPEPVEEGGSIEEKPKKKVAKKKATKKKKAE